MSQASQAFEKFLQGEDRLARLLCELPAYVPSAAAEFEAAFARAARAAQAQQDAMRTATAAGQAAASGTARLESTRLDAIPSAFEPPASLQASFLKMAASIESAQAPRREAILRGIANGDSPQAMLGAAIAPSSEKWLRAQAPAAAQGQPNGHDSRDAPDDESHDRSPLFPNPSPARGEGSFVSRLRDFHAPPSPPARKRAFLGFRWFDLRLAALACVLAVIGTQLALMSDPDPQQVAVQEVFEKALAPRDSSNEAGLAQDDQGSSRRRATCAEADKCGHAAKPAGQGQARRSGARGGTHPRKKSAADAAAPQARLADLADGPPARPSPPPPAAPAAKLALTEAIETAAQQRASESATAPGRPSPATRAAAPSMAASPVPTSRQQATEGGISGISATLADDPADIASQLPARPAGAVWMVYSSQPSQAELERWLEALRQQIPESSRPARFELIRENARRDPQQLRIVPPALPGTR
jgi:hypothetical protein